ncbi:7380_t:CDS:10 [Ambispora gerdemannii]|uniref:7380_t:CDS:1 n=1 Tax=Ambispora gerdemannii TaxID=144530 RepID=A0A9N8YKY4_9GLOM|nr:7380_t:CDS:10 [Ambispora gerdemannii]
MSVKSNVEKGGGVITFDIPLQNPENNVVFVPNLLQGFQQEASANENMDLDSLEPSPSDDINTKTFEEYIIAETERYLTNLQNNTTPANSEFYAVSRPNASQEYFGAATFKVPEQFITLFKPATPIGSPDKPPKKRQAGPGRPRKNLPQEPKKITSTPRERKKDSVAAAVSETSTEPRKIQRKRKAGIVSSDSKETKPRKRATKAKVQEEETKIENNKKYDSSKNGNEKFTEEQRNADILKNKINNKNNTNNAKKDNQNENGQDTKYSSSDGTALRQAIEEQFESCFSSSSLTTSFSSTPEEGSPIDTPTPSRPSTPNKRPTIAAITNTDLLFRLWQASGQAALESSKVCLVNGTATGIGSYTVLDGKTVEASDIGNNFFLDAESIEASRAERVAILLQELNDDAKVITTDLHEKPLLKLSDILWNAKIPLVVVRIVGFIGYIRVVLPEHTVVETHPENISDLRLDTPFPALLEYAKSFDFEKLESLEHSHIPFVVILLKYLDQWRNEHGNKLPSTSAEKNAFKQAITSGKRVPDEENFDEALAGVWKACSVTKIPSEVERIYNDAACSNITFESSSFWIIARAIRDFVENEGHGLLPLAGSLPDMKADTQSYVALQNIYRQKAKEDIALVRAHVHKILSSIGRPIDFISNQEIESFCKHAAFIKVIRYRSLQEEYINNPKKSEIARWIRDPDDNIVHYLLIRAIDQFYEKYQRYPDAATLDEEDGGNESEFINFKSTVSNLFNEYGIKEIPTHVDDFIHETCRAGGSEIPNIASLLGGLVSQEVIKLITQQYIPIDNTTVFQGIRSTSTTYSL